MTQIPRPKFEKVDANTIKIIVEKASDVPLSQILENKKQLLEQKKGVDQALKNIEEILEEAKRLGITAKKPEKPKEPKPRRIQEGTEESKE